MSLASLARIALLAASLFLATQLAWAQDQPDSYTVGPGDVIGVDVFRVPDLTRQGTIDINGQLSYPPLGRLPVAGQGLAEIERFISTQLAELGIFEGAQVTVSLVEARPLFVSGDVSQPGAIPYRAGLTVRQAIALAGGVDPTRRSGAEDPVARAAQLEAERAALEAELNAARLAIDRADAEIAAYRNPDVLSGDAPGDPAPGPSVDASESAILQSRLDDLSAEERRLDTAVSLVERRGEALEDEQEIEREILADQQESFDRLDQMSDSGLITANRIEGTRGILNDTRRRIAELTRQIAETRERLAELRDDRARLPDRRAAQALIELRDQRARLDVLEARISGVDLRLAQLPSALRDLRVTLIRPDGDDLVHSDVELDAPLRPDDTIEVSLLSPYTASTVSD